MIGQVLSGSYRLTDLVGSGGYADVYLARDLRTNTIVAVKILHSHIARDPDVTARFERESTLARRLQTPHVARILDSGQDPASPPFIVMEYVQGLTVAELIRRNGPFPIREAVQIVDQLLSALGAAHALGIIHRDVKPQNLMLDAEGRLKVLDFGVARVVSAGTMTASGHLLGTPEYMASEQVEGRAVDHRSDLYAAGAVMYQLLSGRPPYLRYADTDLWELINRVRTEAPPPVRQLRPEVSPALATVVERAMAKDPAQRYQSAYEMRQALSVAAGIDPPTPQPPPAQPGGMPGQPATQILNDPLSGVAPPGQYPPWQSPPVSYSPAPSPPGSSPAGQHPGQHLGERPTRPIQPIGQSPPGPYPSGPYPTGQAPAQYPPSSGLGHHPSPPHSPGYVPAGPYPRPPGPGGGGYPPPLPDPGPRPSRSGLTPLKVASVAAGALFLVVIGVALGRVVPLPGASTPTPTNAPTSTRAATSTPAAKPAAQEGSIPAAFPPAQVAIKPTSPPKPTTPPKPTSPPPSPTVPPKPTASPNPPGVLLADDFERPEAGKLPRVSSRPDDYLFRYDAGEYVIDKINAALPAAPIVFLPEEYDNTVIAVDVRIMDDVASRYAFVVCRDQSTGGQARQYRASLVPDGRRLVLSRWDDGAQRVLAEARDDPAIQSGNAKNRLELQCAGPKITASVNGKVLASADDLTLSKGNHGLGAGTFQGINGTLVARFDNLEIRSP